MSIVIPIPLLEAALICVAKKDVRFYLEGVAINKGHLVATDGHRMFAAPLEGVDPDLKVIIPSKAIRSFIKKLSPTQRKAKCHFIQDYSRAQLTTLDGGEVESFALVDATYPEWERCMVRKYTKKEAVCKQFNWDYLADFNKMAKILGARVPSPHIYPQPNGMAAPVELNCIDFPLVRATVMPVREFTA